MAQPDGGDVWFLRLGYEEDATHHAAVDLLRSKQDLLSDPPSLSLGPPGSPWATKAAIIDDPSAALLGGDRIFDEDEIGSTTRKKVRLTKEQYALLEERFREQSTLNPAQKAALAQQLNLRPRQVEVWFQNRRARTKLKQTEVDCEFLKTCCDVLTDENRRLHRELEELRAVTFGAVPMYMQAPPMAMIMCPSCERVCWRPPAP